MEAKQRLEAEIEALKSANKINRLKKSHSQLKQESTKPLPRPPPRGLLRDSSAVQVGAGRGK
jgi:hypothetical protein